MNRQAIRSRAARPWRRLSRKELSTTYQRAIKDHKSVEGKLIEAGMWYRRTTYLEIHNGVKRVVVEKDFSIPHQI